MEKVGIAMGYDPSMDVREMAAMAAQAERLGYDMAFFSEALLCNRDSVTALTAFGLATTRITLGATQVVRLRSPVVMAQTLASLDELTGGRIVLAPGACTEKHARRHGLVPVTPAITLRDWVQSLRLLLTGERVTYKGQSVELDNAGLNWRPWRTHVPLWLAALSRTGLQLAGELADGVLLDAHSSPEYVENAVKILQETVRNAGRDWGRFEVAQILPCSVEETHAEAVDAVRWEAASRFESPNFPADTERRLRVGEPAINRAIFPVLLDALASGGKAAVAKALPQALIEQTTACGTSDEVVARVIRYRRAGVTLPLLRSQARHQIPSTMALFAKS
jgi:5,10-methylenetetrahydromethanopterin reductase